MAHCGLGVVDISYIHQTVVLLLTFTIRTVEQFCTIYGNYIAISNYLKTILTEEEVVVVSWSHERARSRGWKQVHYLSLLEFISIYFLKKFWYGSKGENKGKLMWGVGWHLPREGKWTRGRDIFRVEWCQVSSRSFARGADDERVEHARVKCFALKSTSRHPVRNMKSLPWGRNH